MRNELTEYRKEKFNLESPTEQERFMMAEMRAFDAAIIAEVRQDNTELLEEAVNKIIIELAKILKIVDMNILCSRQGEPLVDQLKNIALEMVDSQAEAARDYILQEELPIKKLDDTGAIEVVSPQSYFTEKQEPAVLRDIDVEFAETAGGKTSKIKRFGSAVLSAVTGRRDCN